MKKLLPYVVVLMVALLLAVFESDLLYTAQEHNLFLNTPLFFEQQMVRAGGLLTWAGCYLTQFFYYPLLGAGVLGLLWAFLMWLLKHTFRLADEWLVLVPVACLLLTIVTLGYWVFFLKLPGALFDATLGAIVAVSLVWLYQTLPNRYFLRSLFMVLSTCISYPLFGFYGLWATAMMAMIGWRSSWVALLSVIAVPLVCYHTLYHETNIVNIYWTALPVFTYQGTRCASYYLPYVFMVFSIGLMAFLPSVKKWISATVLTVTAVCVIVFWFKDDNFHRELSMQRSIERQAWQEVINTSTRAKGEPTRAMCMMQNLALFRLGIAGNDILSYPNGAARPKAPFTVHTVHTIGKMLYQQYGVLNYCYRWCMEDGVEYGWTVEQLKHMAQCSLLNGENVAAQRFLNLLKKTTFHRSWAKRYETMIQHPQFVARDPELAPILPLLRNDNFLTADQSQLEMFLIEQLVNTPGATREQQALANFTVRYYRHNRHQIVEK